MSALAVGETLAAKWAFEPYRALALIPTDDELASAGRVVAARVRRIHSGAERAAVRVLLIGRLTEMRPHWSAGEREAVITGLMSEADPGVEWPDAPIPLSAHSELPPFPVDSLPGWVRDWVAAEADATQTPPDMPAMLALSVFATCCARRVRVCVRDAWYESTNVYTCVVLPPSNRKSAVLRDAVAPLEAYEREQAKQLGPSIASAQAEHRIAEQRLKTAESNAAKAKGPERSVAEQDARDLADALRDAETNIPVVPRLVTGDATQEALARLLAVQGGRIAVMDAEGCGPIALMLGRYSQSGAVSIDIYLRGHAGDTIRVDRVGREPITVRDPAVTLAVTTQPEVLRQLGEHREVRGLGLLARILWCVPSSTVGQRSAEPPTMPEHTRAAYASHVRALLELQSAGDGEPHTVRLSADAWSELRALMDRLEPQLGSGGELEHMADWAAKLAGAVARIAGLLHAAEHLAAPWAAQLSPDTMRRAIAIGDYLLAHARAALGSMTAPPVIADAEHVLKWLRAGRMRQISRRDLHRALRGRFTKAADMDPALAMLVEREWIRVPKPEHEPTGPGRRPSPTIEVSPHVWGEGHNGRNRHNTARGTDSVQSAQSVHEVEL